MQENPENVSLSGTDIPEKVMSLGLVLANTMKAKLDNGDDINATAVVMTADMGELESYDIIRERTTINSCKVYFGRLKHLRETKIPKSYFVQAKSQFDGRWFKAQPLPSCCFLRQETLPHIVSLHPGVLLGLD